MRLWVWSLVLLSGFKIPQAVAQVPDWLAARAPIWPPAGELPYAAGAAKKKKKRQISYEITDMWNLIKNDAEELIYESEINTLTSKPSLRLP